MRFSTPKLSIFFLALTVLTLLGSCGQKGPLFIPEEEPIQSIDASLLVGQP